MKEWIYEENGKYYRELTDLIGVSVYKEEITDEEYLGYKAKIKEGKKNMKMADKLIEKARKDAEELSKEYDVPISAIVWKGNNKYIVIKNGKEIEI